MTLYMFEIGHYLSSGGRCVMLVLVCVVSIIAKLRDHVNAVVADGRSVRVVFVLGGVCVSLP